MAFDCSLVISPDKHSDVLAACVQAWATVQAGEVQSSATIFAAKLGAASTGLGAAAAIVAGLLAYLGARASVDEDRRVYRARASAYHRQILSVLSQARDEAEQLTQGDIREKVVTNISILRDNLSPANWESHALLGFAAQANVVDTYRATVALVEAIVGYRQSSLEAFLRFDDLKSAVQVAVNAYDRMVEVLEREGSGTWASAKPL